MTVLIAVMEIIAVQPELCGLHLTFITPYSCSYLRLSHAQEVMGYVIFKGNNQAMHSNHCIILVTFVHILKSRLNQITWFFQFGWFWYANLYLHLSLF